MPDAEEKKVEDLENAESAKSGGEAQAEKTAEPATGTAQETCEIEKLRQELADEKDRAMRLFADFENFRRRTAKERAETFQRAEESVYVELLPVVDNFSRAMGQAGDDPFAQGVKMVFSQLLEFLKKGGVEPIEALGADFDPAVHEAVAYQPSPDAAEGKIIYETRRGYRMGDHVIRPASVIVSSGAPAGAAENK